MFKSRVYYSSSASNLQNSFKEGKTTCIMTPFTGFQVLGARVSLVASRKDITVEEISFFCTTKNKKGPNKDVVFNVDRVDKNNDLTSLFNIDVDKIRVQSLIVQEQNTELKNNKGIANNVVKALHKFTGGIFQGQDISIVEREWDIGNKLCFPKGDFALLEGKNFVLDKSVEGISHYSLAVLCVRKNIVSRKDWVWNYYSDGSKLLYINLDLCKHRETSRMLNVDISKICYVSDSSASHPEKDISELSLDDISLQQVKQSVDLSAQPLDDIISADGPSGFADEKTIIGEGTSVSSDL